MDKHAREFYSTYTKDAAHGHFHEVMILSDHPKMEWHEAKRLAPKLCRGWYELSQLPKQDRIDFTREFWLSKLPYRAHVSELLTKFFASLDDVAIILTQQTYDDPFHPAMVYSLADDSGFFHGFAGADEHELTDLQKQFPDHILPEDYLAFLQIHDGFCKLTDTGIISIKDMRVRYLEFQQLLEEKKGGGPLLKDQPINPHSLIPFYESFGMPFYQCFFADWYPDQEMGNVYYSGATGAISDYTQGETGSENMAFESFLDWLMFYIEKVD